MSEKRATIGLQKMQEKKRRGKFCLFFLFFSLIQWNAWADNSTDGPFLPMVQGSNSGGERNIPGISASEASPQNPSVGPEDSADQWTDIMNGQGDLVYRLDPVNVLGEKHQPGKATIGGKELQTLPSHTGSLTEALKGFSSVQFSNEEISSRTGGEIRPPRVSIAGAKPYENNFLIDGMSVSNTLDPSGLDQNDDSPSWTNLEVHGADQTIFYDTNLIDSVTVHSSNVPVKYGNFLGGVVAAELVDPRTDRWHGVFEGRHTRSEWFDLRSVDDESETSDNQARFRSSSLFASVDGPVNDNLALLTAVSRSWSVIPLRFENDDDTFSDKDQRRYSDNFFAKILLTPASGLKLTLDATYAPYSEERWKSDWADSGWTIENKAYRLGSMLSWSSDAGVLTARAAYSQSGFSRDSASSVWKSNTVTNEQEGGVGDARTTSRALDAKLDFELAEFDTRELLWRISTGIDIKNDNTNMWNEEARVEGLSKTYLTETTYLEHDQTRTLNTLGWYVQPELSWGRFILTPGLRVDYDDYSHNTNVAPRLKAEFDTMGDGMLRIVGGVSRYYGGELRAYAFDRYRPFNTLRTKLSNGDQKTFLGTDRSYLAEDLETPYSDETMGAILGEVMGFEYGLELVHREHKAQLVSKSVGDGLYEMTNDGKSTYDGVTFSLARGFETARLGVHSLSLGITKSRTKTFNGAYDSDIRLDATASGFPYDYDRVYYDGEIMDRGDLPADDYNAPLVVTFSWLGSFYEDRFRVNCVSRWRDSTTGLVKDLRTAAETPYGTAASKATTPTAQWLSPEGDEYYDAYREGVISGGLVTDVSLELDAVKSDKYTVSFLLDVTNVFSSDGHSSIKEENIPQDRMRGRGYYAGIRCEF